MKYTKIDPSIEPDFNESPWVVESNYLYGWESDYFKLVHRPTKDEFREWAYKAYPKMAPYTKLIEGHINGSKWLWDKFIADRKKQELSFKPKLGKEGFLIFLDSSYYKGKIDIIETIDYFCKVNYTRELIYHNKYKTYSTIKVCPSLLKNYPEQNMINTLRDILLEGINNLENNSKVSIFSKYDEMITGVKKESIRSKALLLLSSAPEHSLAGKIWKSIPDLNYSDMDQVITWQNNRSSFKAKHEITKTDRNFWVEIFKPKQHFWFEENNIPKAWACVAFNERRIGQEFVVVEELEIA